MTLGSSKWTNFSQPRPSLPIHKTLPHIKHSVSDQICEKFPNISKFSYLKIALSPSSLSILLRYFWEKPFYWLQVQFDGCLVSGCRILLLGKITDILLFNGDRWILSIILRFRVMPRIVLSLAWGNAASLGNCNIYDLFITFAVMTRKTLSKTTHSEQTPNRNV